MLSGPATDAAPPDRRGLGTSLAPLVAEACDGRLGEITWFKADWQRGGAATGSAMLDDGTDRAAAVILKLPVVERELRWTRRLQGDPDEGSPVVPRLYAAGETLGGYDLAWLLIEKFEYGPLGLHWHPDHVKRIADAAARFTATAARYPVDQPPRVEPWDELLRDSVQSARTNGIEPRARWQAALKQLQKKLDPIVKAWQARRADEWLHGDLHLANAMSRESADHGDVGLIDLAEVHVGHWIEDAVYLERQLWARPERLKASPPVRAMAAARRRHGLPVDDDYSRLATIRRTLLAGSAPRYIKSEGHPRHLEACLERLEAGLGELK